jgi:hypothetical protein
MTTTQVNQQIDTINKGKLDNIEVKEIFFNDNYLIEETDKKLIDVQKVESDVKQLLNNYKSNEYHQYNKLLNKIPKIFGKKTFKIEYKKESIKIYKIKKDGESTLIHNIVKPIISNIINFENELHNINYQRTSLKKTYVEHVTGENVSLADKNKFIKDKNTFIELLEKFYTHKNYHMIVNNLVGSENYTTISISSYLPFINTKTEYDNQLFFSQYKINPEVIEEINENKIKSLNNFNNIRENLSLNNDKELKEIIKQYLNKDDKEVVNKINKVIKEQDEDINYIVERLPKIEQELHKYLE